MTTTFALNCPICLDKIHDPVVTPCGHFGCDACIKAYARGSGDPYKATCPTCRTPFSTVMPDLSDLPKKYHTFVSPPLRRVFLDVPENNSRALTKIKNLKAEIAVLKERVKSHERNARLAPEDKQNLKHFRAKNRPVERWAAVNRTSGQAALDDGSPSSGSSNDSSSNFELDRQSLFKLPFKWPYYQNRTKSEAGKMR